MQIRSRAYLHFISLWRSLRDAIPPHRDDVPDAASPSLIYAVIVLASFLVILEVDAHRIELESLGLLGGGYFIQAVFLGP